MLTGTPASVLTIISANGQGTQMLQQKTFRIPRQNNSLYFTFPLSLYSTRVDSKWQK